MLDGWQVQKRCPHLKADLSRLTLAEDDEARRGAALLQVLAERHGLSDLALGTDPGELVAVVAAGRTYLDVTVFELDVLDTVGWEVRVTPAGAPGARVGESLSAASAA